MNKAAIKNFAIEARKKLIASVKDKAGRIGITKDSITDPISKGEGYAIFPTHIGIEAKLTGKEIKQRENLVNRIKSKENGYELVMEEAAYTWFNRLIAIRFMEVNDYLPSRVRVLSSETAGKFEPDIVTQAPDVDLEFSQTEIEEVLTLKEKNALDQLFRLLFIRQCNELGKILPELFENTSKENNDYTEILLDISYTNEDGVLRDLLKIDEADFLEAVEIIGWLYQYYNTEPKDETFALLKKNVKITKERIPAATQLFTPDWIVRYMVENSLGRIFVVNSGQWAVGSERERIEKETALAEKMGWKYYLPEAEQSEEVRQQLITNHYALTTDFRIENVKVIDPCMGSGHILVYAFDVLMDIYKSCGYTERDAAKLILQHNLYGLDIDDRAYQLAYFAVMMKARSYNRRIFSSQVPSREGCPQGGVCINLCAIQESNLVDSGEWVVDSGAGSGEVQDTLQYVLDVFTDAKEYGSILHVEQRDYQGVLAALAEWESTCELTLENHSRLQQLPLIRSLLRQADVMARKYDVVVTNPPYMGISNGNGKLNDFVKKYYPDSKADLFAVFIEKCRQLTKKQCYQAMITQHSWMFLSSFEKLRAKLQMMDTVNMAHLGARAFEEISGEVVQTTSWVQRKSNISEYWATYARLVGYGSQQEKERAFLAKNNLHFSQKGNFSKIPGMPVAYWSNLRGDLFDNQLKDVFSSGGRNKTHNDAKYVRYFWEVKNIDKKWVFYENGGYCKKYYGNEDMVVNWSEEARSVYASHGGLCNPRYWTSLGITWNKINSNSPGFRIKKRNSLYSSMSPTILGGTDEEIYYILGFLNSKVLTYLLTIINPTTTTNVGEILSMPLVKYGNLSLNFCISLATQNVNISKTDWDSFETSWDFTRHPFLKHYTYDDRPLRLAAIFRIWETETEEAFTQLKANEEELNRIFIDIYGLQDELTPEVEDKDITICKADLQRDIRSFISYAVGCMFGRYSLDVDGLVYAGGVFSEQWAVVSGKYYLKEVVGRYVSEELSRLDCMAESNGFGGGSVSVGQNVAERGNVCTFRSNEAGGSVDSLEYSGRAISQINQGVYSVSVGSEGVKSGTGDTTNDLCAPPILGAITSRNRTKLVAGGWENAGNIDWQTIHSTLTTNHSPLTTHHSPLITNHYPVDTDNILPITDNEYFTDDIVTRFVEFIKVVYGQETLEENLDFIAQALGNKGNTSREIIRNYFLKDFYADHVKVYQKRPIYWLFDSGKENGFKALIYMHRYDQDTVGRVRADYLHKTQAFIENAISHCEVVRESNAPASEKAKAVKQKEKLVKQLAETRLYDQAIAHIAHQRIAIDLDDGVVVNYAKFQGVEVANEGKKTVKIDLLAKI